MSMKRFQNQCYNILLCLFFCFPHFAFGDLDSGTCLYPYKLLLTTISGGKEVKFPDGLSYFFNRSYSPHWIYSGFISGESKVSAQIEKIQSITRVSPLAHAMGGDHPLPTDADQAALFNDNLTPHQNLLILFGKNKCAVEIAIVNSYGLFTTSPDVFLLSPNEFLNP